MAVRMAALNSSATGATKARKVIPKDARAEYKRLYGVGREAILKVPAGTSKAQAKALHGQWLAEVETRIERIGEGPYVIHPAMQSRPLRKQSTLLISLDPNEPSY